MSAKVPAVVRLAKEALTKNKCVVVGLQSTGEARTEEAVSKYVCFSFTNFLNLSLVLVRAVHLLMNQLIFKIFILHIYSEAGPGT